MHKAKRKLAASEISRNGLREALLGLIAIKPMTGYDLTRSYRRALQQIWYAPLGQVYPTLRKMKGDGLLRMSVKVQQHRPDRKVYTLTAAGRKLLVSWLSQPALLPRMHHEFIHKLFLLNNIDVSQRNELIEAYIKRSDDWARDLRRAEAMLEQSLRGPNAESAWFQLLSLRHLCRIVECEAISAHEIAEALRTNPAPKLVRPAAPTAKQTTAFAGQSLSPTEQRREGFPPT